MVIDAVPIVPPAPVPASDADASAEQFLLPLEQPVEQAAAPSPEPPPKRSRRRKPKLAQRARALVREQLKDGPKLPPRRLTKIPERALIRAASALKVRTQRGQWWLPG